MPGSPRRSSRPTRYQRRPGEPGPARSLLASSDAIPDADRELRHPVGAELIQVIDVVDVDGRAQEEIIGEVPTGRDGCVLLKVIGARASRDLGAGQVIIRKEIHARAADAQAELRFPSAGSESWPVDGIHGIERRAVRN